MAAIDDKIKAAQDSESALEARVTAHEAHETQVAADLQAQVDVLKAGSTSTADAATNLQALVDRMNNFDPDAATPNNPDGTPLAQGQLPSDQGGTAPALIDASGQTAINPNP